MEKFTICSSFNDGCLLIEGSDLSYDEAKELANDLVNNKDEYYRMDINDILFFKQYNPKYFGFDIKKKEVEIDYTLGVIIIDGVEHELSEWNKIKGDSSYTVTKITGHPTPDGECLDEYLV